MGLQAKSSRVLLRTSELKHVVQNRHLLYFGVFPVRASARETPGKAGFASSIQLDHLKDRSFEFTTEPTDGIFNVQLRTMQLSVPDKNTGRITFELRHAFYVPPS